jgi:serine/threonine-protein kinase HipA
MKNISSSDVFLNQNHIGKLAITPDDLCAFEYDAEYIKTGISISPFILPIENRVFIAKRTPFAGGFGVFGDSLPDGWGNLILDYYLKQKGIDPYKLTVLERLSLIGSTGRGALEYIPDNSTTTKEELIDFDLLAEEAEKILSSKDYEGKVDTLYQYGSSSGGARPKIFAKIDNKEWLVKFKSSNDSKEIGQIEYDYSLLAKECGIEMPDTKLIGGKYFAVERFDRTKEGKIHTISASGLLNADYRIPSLDYIELLKACAALTHNMEEVYKLFRQMIFNIIISNRDDHSKNFSFQLINNNWQLSPAYDLLPSIGFNGYHTTTINNQGEPTLKDISEVAKIIGLNKQRTKRIYEEIIDICLSKKMLKYSIK